MQAYGCVMCNVTTHTHIHTHGPALRGQNRAVPVLAATAPPLPRAEQPGAGGEGVHKRGKGRDIFEVI